MSVLLDEETVVLEALDFEERCMSKTAPEHSADFVTRFRCCGAGALLCERHLANQRKSVDALLARGERIICGYCAAEFVSYEDSIEVIPL